MKIVRISSGILSKRFHSSSSPNLAAEKVKRMHPVANLDYCMDLVKKHDYENFLCTLLVPEAQHRAGIFAIRAFNTEIALIRDQVTQKDIGLGRFVFWREAVRLLFKARLNGDYKQIPNHPVVDQLSKQVMDMDVQQKWLINLIESREEGLADAQFSTLAELETYCDKSVTPVLYLILDLLNFKHIALDHTCSHLGKAIGLTNFIRAIPYNAQKRRVLVPRELLLKHNVSQEDFIRLSEADKIQAVIFDLAAQAHRHYEIAKSHEGEIKKLYQQGSWDINPIPFLLCAQPTRIYLKRLEKCNFNPYDASLTRRHYLLPAHLYYRRRIGDYY